MDMAVDAGPTVPELSRRRTPLGEVLLSLGAIKDADRQRILAVQSKRGGRFGRIAVSLRMITEDELRYALAQQFDYPVALRGASALSPLLVTAYEPFGSFAESLRTLRSQLLMRRLGEEDAIVAIIAARAVERHSSLAANLAVTFAQLGENTLLIDANLRTPVQHQLFGLSGREGLADVLTGHCRAPQALQPVPPFRCLSVLCAGTVPPNPQELLSGPQFTQLIEEMRDRFDCVILDTPPLLQYADAQVIAARARRCLVGTRRNVTRIADIARLRLQLDARVAQILGAVVCE